MLRTILYEIGGVLAALAILAPAAAMLFLFHTPY